MNHGGQSDPDHQDDSSPKTRRTTCNRDCPDACGIIATVENGRVTRLSGDPEHPITRGFLCYRTSHFLSTQYGAQRVVTPLLRGSLSHKLLPVSWSEAIHFVADKLKRICEESGPESIFFYRSGGSLGMMSAVVELFWEAFGPVTTKSGDICSGAGDAAQLEDFGLEDSNDLLDLHNARTILLWGKNAHVASPHLLPLLKESQKRGARLILIDPVFHKTPADAYIQVRPGGDFALAMAVTQMLIDGEKMDKEALSHCDNVPEFFEMARSRSVSQWLSQADVKREDAELIARSLADEKPATILIGWGMGRRQNGAAIVRALDALAAVTGNLGIPGGGASFYFRRRNAFDLSFLKSKPPRTVCEPLFGKEILALRDPPIRAVWIMCGNPVVMLPESNTTAKALSSRELVVVCDHNRTDTADLAHVVFPTTTLLESDDLLGSYGHHYLSASKPVIPSPKEVKSDLEIIQALAAQLGLAEVVAGTPQAWKETMIASKLKPHGITMEMLERGAVRNPLSPVVLFSDRRFPTKTARVNLIDRLPPEPARPTTNYPMLLMAVSSPDSQCSQWALPQDGPLELTVHPDSANGMMDGSLGELCSALGTLVVVVRHDKKQRRDVALVPKGGHLRDGRCANALVQAKLTDSGEGGALFDQPVRLQPRTAH